MHEELLQGASFTGRVLGPLLLERPDSDTCSAIADEFAKLDSLIDWPLGNDEVIADAFALIKEGVAEGITYELQREYARLFEGPAAFAAPVWGSVYLDRDCVVFGSSTLELRRWLRGNGVSVEYPEREPEDQIGRMLLLTAWLAENKPECLPEMLEQHLLTWSSHFFEQFIADARHPFYKGVAMLADASLLALRDELGLEVPKRTFYR